MKVNSLHNIIIFSGKWCARPSSRHYNNRALVPKVIGTLNDFNYCPYPMINTAYINAWIHFPPIKYGYTSYLLRKGVKTKKTNYKTISFNQLIRFFT